MTSGSTTGSTTASSTTWEATLDLPLPFPLRSALVFAANGAGEASGSSTSARSALREFLAARLRGGDLAGENKSSGSTALSCSASVRVGPVGTEAATLTLVVALVFRGISFKLLVSWLREGFLRFPDAASMETSASCSTRGASVIAPAILVVLEPFLPFFLGEDSTCCSSTCCCSTSSSSSTSSTLLLDTLAIGLNAARDTLAAGIAFFFLSSSGDICIGEPSEASSSQPSPSGLTVFTFLVRGTKRRLVRPPLYFRVSGSLGAADASVQELLLTFEVAFATAFETLAPWKGVPFFGILAPMWTGVVFLAESRANWMSLRSSSVPSTEP